MATKVGYSNFREGIPSDHRVMWVESLLKNIFGIDDKITKRITMLKSKWPKGRKKYIYRTKEELQKHDCLQKMQTLHTIPKE